MSETEKGLHFASPLFMVRPTGFEPVTYGLPSRRLPVINSCNLVFIPHPIMVFSKHYHIFLFWCIFFIDYCKWLMVVKHIIDDQVLEGAKKWQYISIQAE